MEEINLSNIELKMVIRMLKKLNENHKAEKKRHKSHEKEPVRNKEYNI